MIDPYFMKPGVSQQPQLPEKSFIQQVKDYYPTYLSVHQNKWNRRLHFLGQILTLLSLLTIAGNLQTLWFLLPLVPFIIYPFAWGGHIFIEKNKPATWSVSPFITKSCDWVMFRDIVNGKIPF